MIVNRFSNRFDCDRLLIRHLFVVHLESAGTAPFVDSMSAAIFPGKTDLGLEFVRIHLRDIMFFDQV